MSRTRSRSIRSKMATRPKLPRVCFRCRRFPGCGERNKNDEARMTNDEGITKSEGARKYENSFWMDGETLLVREEPRAKPVYDLEERTARFGEAVIDFAKTIPQGPTTDRIISQLIGAATSVGANYIEADDSVSKREFLKCIGTCKKE